MAKIFYARVDEFWRKEEKYKYLEERQQCGNIEWQELTPDARQTWLTEGRGDEFAKFIPIGNRETKAVEASNVQAIFKLYSLGVSSNRDDIVYGFDTTQVATTIERFCDDYNAEVNRYLQKGKPENIDDFISYEKVKWSESLKSKLKSGRLTNFDLSKLRCVFYRPFAKSYLYFDHTLIDRPGLFEQILPHEQQERENKLIWLKIGSEIPMFAIAINQIPNLLTQGGS